MEPGTAEQRNAWDKAIREHNRTVVLSLLAIGLGPETAREIAQAAWTKLIEKERTGALSEIVLPGLALRQARFLALDEIRRRSSEDSALRVVPLPTASQNPEKAYSDRQRLERVTAVLAKQPAKARTVFRLVYAPPHLSHAEAAKRVGLSLQRVRQILCETRKHLRASLLEGQNS